MEITVSNMNKVYIVLNPLYTTYQTGNKLAQVLFSVWNAKNDTVQGCYGFFFF